MEFLTFIKQSILHPSSIGAVLPSSKYTAKKMVEGIDFDNARFIVELGPGTGVFTNEILKNRKEGTIVVSIEFQEKFCSLLKEKFKDENDLHIINGSAEHIDKYLEEKGIPHIDYIVSGLPFLSLPEDMSKTILQKASGLLADYGRFNTIAYTKLQLDFIGNYFKGIDILRELRNVPPAYILSFRKQ